MYSEADEGFRFIEAAVDLNNGEDFADVKKSLDESCRFASKSNLVIPAALICASFFVFSYIFSGKIKSVEVRELITE